jgi:pimeloyl-ACP methyl ester carboxylesterase
MQPTFKHQPKEGYLLTRDQHRLHYLEWGDPSSRPLILLHGFTSHSHGWDFLADSLCEQYRILALDLRGHGESAWSRNGYTNDLYVRDLEDLVAHKGLSRMSLLGMSLGGLNVMQYAAQHPERVERLIIVDIGPELPLNGKPKELFSLFTGQSTFASQEEAFAYRRRHDRRPVEELERHLTYHAVKQLPSGMWGWKYDPDFRSPLKLFLVRTPFRFLTDIRLPNLWHVLPAIQCPTLVLRGAQSPVLSQRVAEEMTRQIPKGKLIVFSGCGHRLHIERPREFEEAVRQFLEQ